MRPTAIRLLAAAVFLAAVVLPALAAGDLSRKYSSTTTTRTVTATIVKIDAAAEVIVLENRQGKRWEVTVPGRSGIDLGRYRVGDKVTATFANVVSSTSAPRTKTKTHELLKLE
jgi:hypothetical protein